MEQIIEKEISLPRVSVLIANIQWHAVQEFHPLVPGYYLCQRLSDNHSALRIKNFTQGEIFPHVRSVGLLPPRFAVQALPLEKPFRALNCIFEKAFFEETTDIDPRWHDNSNAFLDIRNTRLSGLMQQIYTELESPSFGTSIMIEAASTMMLVEMARYVRLYLGIADSLGGESPRGGLAPWQVRRIRDRVEAALELGYPNLEELSTLCRLSQGHLMRSFKISTGVQIHKYIAEHRLTEAKRLLLETQLAAAEISAELGFSSPAYFSAAFRRMTGQTPSHFRQGKQRTLN